MATLSVLALTLADWAKGLDPNGAHARVIEMLEQSNEILQDFPFMEGNLPTGHRTTVRTGLATASWRLLNAGVVPSKSHKAQIDEQAGQLESWSQCDKKLAELGGNVSGFRMSEAIPHVEAVAQEMAATIFYGNPSAPEEFTGLSARYSDLSAANGSHILDAGGSGSDNSSIWMMDLGENSLTGIFPKGSTVGITHEDKGEVIIQNANGVTGALMVALVDRWRWEAGIALKDWRKVVRIANIDISNLTGESGAANLTKLLIKAYHRIRNKRNCRIYANPTVIEFLDIQRHDNVVQGGGLTYDTIDGKQVMSFRGIPIRNCDALLETEAAVS